MWLLEASVLALVCVAAASIVWSTLRLGISPMPTSRAVREVVLAMTPRELEGEVHELGAGWGTLAFALAAHCPQAKIIAWEASPFPFFVCWLRARLTPRPNLELRFADFFGADLRAARLVVTYLWTGGMERLRAKLDAELPAGAQVLSHTFALRGREAAETRHAADLYRTAVFRYVQPTNR